MTNKKTIILGNGGHAAVLTEILLQQNVNILGYTAPEKEKNPFDLNYLGDDEIILRFKPSDVQLVIGIGMLAPHSLKKKIYERFKSLGFCFNNVIHSAAIVSPYAKLGEGVQIMAGAIIQIGCSIADNTIINTGAIVDHDCQVGKHIHIAPGVKISGAVTIRDNTHIGTGATIIQGISVGENCLIAAGAVVVKDIYNDKVVKGIPAKEV